jgi:hypothetical protein
LSARKRENRVRNDAESADEFQPKVAVASFSHREGAFVEDPEPPYRAAQEESRDAERDLERRASGGHTADDDLGYNGKPLVVGDIAHVAFGVLFGDGKKAMEKSGTLLSIAGGVARVRLNGSKDTIGDAFPFSRVRTEPINGGRPLKSKAEKKTAAQHAHHLAEYRDALNGGEKPRPSDGFEHAHAAADETVPLPRRVLQGHNRGVSEGTLYRHAGILRRHQEEVASANGRLRQAVKAAKDDGVDVRVLKQIMAELKMSPEEIVAATNDVMSYRAAFSLPNTGPLAAPEPPDPNDAGQRKAYAEELGRIAGFRGAAADTNPYPDSADECHLAWDSAWRESQSKLLLGGIREL